MTYSLVIGLDFSPFLKDKTVYQVFKDGKLVATYYWREQAEKKFRLLKEKAKLNEQ